MSIGDYSMLLCKLIGHKPYINIDFYYEKTNMILDSYVGATCTRCNCVLEERRVGYSLNIKDLVNNEIERLNLGNNI